MASRKEYDMLFQLKAQLGGGYNSAFKQAQSAIASMQKEISALGKVQSDISAYQKQQGAVEATGKKLEVLQQQYANIQREISETEEFSSSLENSLLQKQQQIDKTTASLSAQTDKLGDMGDALREAGVDVSDLGGKSEALSGEIEKLKRSQEEAADKANKFGTTTVAAFGAIQQAVVAAGVAVALREIADQAMSCVDASVEFESVMAGVRRTVGGTDEELAAIAGEFKQMSQEIPITTTELGRIAETAGQLGIAQEAVTEFTEVMAMLATTTDLTAENAATMLAQFANITGLTDYGRLGATVAELGDATATTASKVVEMSQGMAAAASLAGFAETDIMAVAAAVGSLGIESQAGATAMSTLIQTLYKAVETGDGLAEFASVANMSAEEFSSAWGQNAVGAMDAFIQGLNDTERNGQSAIVILEALGITNVRQTKAILGLASAGDLLSDTIAQANRAWEENAALGAKADIMYGTTESKLVMMENAYNNLKIAVGDNFTPELQKLYGIASDVMVTFTEFVERNPVLVKAGAAYVGIIGLATAALTAYAAIVKIIKALNLASVFAAAAPILAAVAAVAALAAAVVFLSSAIKEHNKEYKSLTATSKQHYNQLEQLNAEYEEAIALHGETDDRVRELEADIARLGAEYEYTRMTMAEFIAQNEKLIESHDRVVGSFQEGMASLDGEARSAMALITAMDGLSSKASLTASEQMQLEAVVAGLNQQFPDLTLSIEESTGALNMTAEAVHNLTTAQIEQQRVAQQYESFGELLADKEDLTERIALAKEEAAAAKSLYNNATGWDWLFGVGDGSASNLQEYYDEVDRLNDAYEETVRLLEEHKQAFDEAAAAAEEAAQRELEAGGAINQVIGDVVAQMEELAQAYVVAYEAALSSVQGQYSLWDEAAAVVEKSAGSINSALESQISYWQDYNENLGGLSERGRDIEGLTEMIASFADGSADSVNAVAGMASATDEQLADMVANWQKLQEEQKLVAGSLAELETDFEQTMANLQSELETTIEEMNLSEEAAESGRNTIQGFIDGAEDMLPAVRDAFVRIGEAGLGAIDVTFDMHSPSRVMAERGAYTIEGFVGEVQAMEPEVAAAMSGVAGAGIDAFTEEEARVVAIAPQLMAYLTARNGYEPVSANTGVAGSGDSIVITVAPVYNVEGVGDTGGLESILRAHDDDLKDYILEVVEEAGIDAERRVYR